MPAEFRNPDPDSIRDLLRKVRTIAVVGLSPNPRRPSHGVARALLRAAESHARATGACGLELATAHTNTPAQRLYESLGWQLDTTFRHYELTC